MQLGRVIGNVVATIKDPNHTGVRLLVVQKVDERLEPLGKPLAAVDVGVGAGPGDVVYLVFKRDAAIALGDKPPIDAAIVGYVDEISAERKPGVPAKRWTP